jgi:hypothetical protein
MSAEHEAQFSARFRLDHCLGRGGYGVVYLAHDRKHDTPVALKILSTMQPGHLYRFKQEFRGLADLRHPNLVRLYELVAEGEHWFFTMEPVDGQDFRHAVCQADAPPGDNTPTISVAADSLSDADAVAVRPRLPMVYRADLLRSALRQLVAGLQHLHAAGTLHRDLKPPNVLIARDGRLVILDFGLAVELDSEGEARSLHLAGTPVYMSPEQSAGAALSAASDWYSVGLMLYEVLTGGLPFEGPVVDVLQEKQRWEPGDAAFPAKTPDDLAAVCKALLRLDPVRRAGGSDVLHFLGEERPSIRSAVRRPRQVFVGRRAELAALKRAFAATVSGRAAVATVHGSSGIGKSALVRQFLDALPASDPDVLVVRARCYEHESVPYKGLDSLVDALGQYLSKLSPLDLERVLPREMQALARLFPVLDDVCTRVERRRTAPLSDPLELRRRGGRALRELVERISDTHQVVLVIDDFQWGDVDSARLLQEILQPPDPPAVLFVVAYRREESESSACVRDLLAFVRHNAPELECHDVPIAEMSLDESRDLVRAISRHEVPPDEALQIAREAEGIPFFVKELFQQRQESAIGQPPRSRPQDVGGLDNLMTLSMAQLDPSARAVLEVLAVAGRPVPYDVLIRATHVPGPLTALEKLRERRLVRSRIAAEHESLEVYHARMAKGVLASLSADQLRERHRELAAALETDGQADAEILYRHYHEAGDGGRALEFAVRAAREAWKALAFNRAADLYTRALEAMPSDDPSRLTLTVHLGDALASAGRGDEAARAYLAAAEAAVPGEKLPLHQKAMAQFFRTGRFDEGLATLRTILPALRLRWPETPRRALLALLARRLQLRWRGLAFEERPATVTNESALLRIDACWSISSGLSVVDTVRATLFQTQGLLWALDAGEPQRIVRAMALEGAFGAVAGVRSRPRTEAVFERSTALADRVNTPEARGLVLVARGVALTLYGEWRQAVDTLNEAERLLIERTSDVTQELDNARVFGLVGLIQLGDYREIRARLPALLRDADARGDLYARTMFSLQQSLIMLAAGQPDDSRRMADEAIAGWSRAGFHSPHFNDLYRQTEIDLYRGDAAGALSRLTAGWQPLKQSHILRNQFALIEITHLRARARIAAAASDRRLLADALQDAARIERQQTRWGGAFAMLVRAGVAAARGERESAVTLLLRAETLLEQTDMGLHLAAARWQRGAALGAAEGSSLVADAHATMTAQGIAEPERYAGVLVPAPFQ